MLNRFRSQVSAFVSQYIGFVIFVSAIVPRSIGILPKCMQFVSATVFILLNTGKTKLLNIHAVSHTLETKIKLFSTFSGYEEIDDPFELDYDSLYFGQQFEIKLKEEYESDTACV